MNDKAAEKIINELEKRSKKDQQKLFEIVITMICYILGSSLLCYYGGWQILLGIWLFVFANNMERKK
jgi:hypothetical protein